MPSEDPALWSDFAIALVGAAAALAGLLFVAISINLREILKTPALTGRAGEAILTLGFVLVACGLLLVPGQTRSSIGLQLLVLTIGLFAILLRLHVRAIPDYDRSQRAILAGRIFTHHLVVVLFALAAVGSLTGTIGGLLWIAPATLWGVVVGISDGWVLLVEILR